MLPGETILSGGVVDHHVSEFQVMGSPGGYYIGTIWTCCGECEECKQEKWMPKGWQEPNSRETDYFDTREEAEKALEAFKKTNEMPSEMTAHRIARAHATA